jgi:hypothetical protein
VPIECKLFDHQVVIREAAVWIAHTDPDEQGATPLPIPHLYFKGLGEGGPQGTSWL